MTFLIEATLCDDWSIADLIDMPLIPNRLYSFYEMPGIDDISTNDFALQVNICTDALSFCAATVVHQAPHTKVNFHYFRYQSLSLCLSPSIRSTSVISGDLPTPSISSHSPFFGWLFVRCHKSIFCDPCLSFTCCVDVSFIAIYYDFSEFVILRSEWIFFSSNIRI